MVAQIPKEKSPQKLENQFKKTITLQTNDQEHSESLLRIWWQMWEEENQTTNKL